MGGLILQKIRTWSYGRVMSRLARARKCLQESLANRANKRDLRRVSGWSYLISSLPLLDQTCKLVQLDVV